MPTDLPPDGFEDHPPDGYVKDSSGPPDGFESGPTLKEAAGSALSKMTSPKQIWQAATTPLPPLEKVRQGVDKALTSLADKVSPSEEDIVGKAAKTGKIPYGKIIEKVMADTGAHFSASMIPASPVDFAMMLGIGKAMKMGGVEIPGEVSSRAEINSSSEVSVQKTKAPWDMTKEEFNKEESKGMGESWQNAVKDDSGKIHVSNTEEHGNMVPRLRDAGLVGDTDKPQYRGWVWKGLDKEKTFIDVGDLEKTGGDFHQAYLNRKPVDPTEMINQVAQDAVKKVTPPEYEGPEAELIGEDTKRSLTPKLMNVPDALVDSSPKLKGTDTAPAMKPEIIPGTRSFSQEVYNRLLVPAAEAVAKQGQFGQLLANDIRFIRDYPTVKYGMDFGAPFERMYNAIPDEFKEEVGNNLSAALEGREHDISKIPTGMKEFVQDALKKISDEATELDMKVVRHEPIPIEDQSFDGPKWTPKLVDFAPRENYFPRVIKQDILEDIVREDKGRMGEMAKHLVDSKQAPTFNAAMENIRLWRKNLLDRKYGNLERARELDLPPKFYETNAFKVIPYYMKTAMQRLAEVRVFGHNDMNALMKIEGISREGHDADLALRTFRRVTGRDPIDAVAKGMFRAIRNWATGSLIQFQTTLYHLPRTMYPAVEAGYLRAAKGFMKSFGEASEIESRNMGINLSKAMSEYLQEEYGGGGKTMSGKFANAAMTIEGIKPLDRFQRKFAAITGKDWVQNDLVKTLLKSPGNKRARVGLQDLGIDPDKIVKAGKIDELDLNVAAKRFSDRTMGAPDATTLPIWWTSPAGKMYAQFKNFMYVISREMGSVISRAVETKDAATLARMATLPMAGAGVYGIRHVINMRDTQYVQDPKINMAINILRDTAPLPVGVDVFFKVLQGKKGVHDLLIPPSLGSAADLIGDIGESVSKGKVTKSAKKDILRHVPLVGTALSHEVK